MLSGYNFALLICLTYLVVNNSFSYASTGSDEKELPLAISRYLNSLKSQYLKLNDSFRTKGMPHKHNHEMKQGDKLPATLPDGLPPQPAEGPGEPPENLLRLVPKNAGNHERGSEWTCKDHEWFVFTDDMPACVNPVWEGGYDPTFCAKLKSGWVYCGCEDDQVPGMKEGLDTCINTSELTRGHCAVGPCPRDFKCIDQVSLHRFDCIKGDVTVPTWTQYPKLNNSFGPNKSSNQQMDENKRNDKLPALLPDGFPPEAVVAPGNPPRKYLKLINKRDGKLESDGTDLTCKDHEWFVFTDNMPACVNPVWEGGYDPTFCAKLKSGMVYCGCEEDQVPGIKEGLDTCVDTSELVKGRCAMSPCPQDFKCEDHPSRRRFDCVKGDITVPTWY